MVHVLVRRFALILPGLLALGCGSSSGGGDSGEREAASLFGTRYCEVLLAETANGFATISVYNTVSLNQCPAELWDALDTEQIAS